LTDFDLGEIVRAHEASGALATLTLTHVANPLEYGVIVTDSQGFVTQFLEKPTWGEVISDTVNTGIYVLDPEVLAYIPDNTPFDFSQDLFPAMMAAGDSIYGHIADGYWCDVGNIEEYMQANADVLARTGDTANSWDTGPNIDPHADRRRIAVQKARRHRLQDFTCSRPVRPRAGGTNANYKAGVPGSPDGRPSGGT